MLIRKVTMGNLFQQLFKSNNLCSRLICYRRYCFFMFSNTYGINQIKTIFAERIWGNIP